MHEILLNVNNLLLIFFLFAPCCRTNSSCGNPKLLSFPTRYNRAGARVLLSTAMDILNVADVCLSIAEDSLNTALDSLNVADDFAYIKNPLLRLANSYIHCYNL